MHRRLLLTALGGNVPINLEIEGSLSAITTIAQLASFLGIATSKIRSFTNSGTFIQANIRGNYQIPANQFLNNTSMSKFRDVGGLIDTINAQSFRNTQLSQITLPKLKYSNGMASLGYNSQLVSDIDLPELVTYSTGSTGMLQNNSLVKVIKLINLESIAASDNAFANLISLELLDLRRLRYYDVPSVGSTAAKSGFANLKTGCEIRVNIFLRTANAGNPDVKLNWVKNNRGAIVKFYDDNGNYVSTL